VAGFDLFVPNEDRSRGLWEKIFSRFFSPAAR
jgi:hypothetical protein